MSLPLEVKAALPCPRIADRSGSMETDGDWLLAFLCCTNKNDNHNEMFQESTSISAFESGKKSLTLCHTITLCSMAHPHRTIPTLIRILVVMAGVDGNWSTVYKTTSVTKTTLSGCGGCRVSCVTSQKDGNGNEEGGDGADSSYSRIFQEFSYPALVEIRKRLTKRLRMREISRTFGRLWHRGNLLVDSTTCN